MSTTQVDRSAPSSGTTTVPFRLEVVVIPVADFERAKSFYVGLGWRVDADADSGTGYKLMQITPPGSNASIIFGTQVTAAPPGSSDGLLLAVDDLDQAREELAARGVEVSPVFHIGDEGRALGHDPERRSYASYASFHDSEGNRYVLQEITTRLPGRV